LNQNISNTQNNIDNIKLRIPDINYQGAQGQEYWRLQYTTNSINYKISELALKLHWRDQGWGNQKGLIDIRLCNYVQEYEQCTEQEIPQFMNIRARWVIPIVAPHIEEL